MKSADRLQQIWEVPSRAEEDYKVWQSAIDATRHFREVYNEWFAEVDHNHLSPTSEQAFRP